MAPLAAVCIAAVGLLMAIPAAAVPTLLGGQLYYTGGDVTIDVLHSDSAFEEVLLLRSIVSTFELAECAQVGSQYVLTAKQLANLGIAVGDELQFGIRVFDTGQTFLLGSGDRNGDGVAHAYVRPSHNSVFYYAGFEDFYGGGDRDYNDTIFRFSGGTTADPLLVLPHPGPGIPEPSSLLLLLSGLGFLGIGRRKG